ncbi:hypothetical protein MANES_15G073800v8 [Manihot esculenta]|uniref:Uncharacterized protein n=1 Tax=Manihot esculenta TaxID=3983 RepID=A0ACB7G9V3_MANES|nr:hypothetical protein MANES_15G073800v8 [Manihot esculenta]
MEAQTPVDIGTQGTIGSLIMQELRHFSQLQLRCPESSQKPNSHTTGTASTSRGQSKPTLGSVVTTPKKKKKGRSSSSSSRLLPSICSMVEVSNNHRPTGISDFSYRNLKSDAKNLQV